MPSIQLSLELKKIVVVTKDYRAVVETRFSPVHSAVFQSKGSAAVVELSDDDEPEDDRDPDIVRKCNLYMIQALEEMRWESVQEDIDATRADIARIGRWNHSMSVTTLFEN